MAWVIANPLQYVGRQPVGSGPCAALAQTLGASLKPPVPLVAHWKRGVLVKGRQLTPGTVIAVFNSNGDYQGSKFAQNVHGKAHTALYVRQTAGNWTLASAGRVTYRVSHSPDDGRSRVECSCVPHE